LDYGNHDQDEVAGEAVGPDARGEDDRRIRDLPRRDDEAERDRRVGDLEHSEHERDHRDAVAEPGDRRACEEEAEVAFG
jgi:hypothetical protein